MSLSFFTEWKNLSIKSKIWHFTFEKRGFSWRVSIVWKFYFSNQFVLKVYDGNLGDMLTNTGRIKYYELIFTKLWSRDMLSTLSVRMTLIHLTTFNRAKLGRAITFIKYLASIVYLISVPKTSCFGNQVSWILQSWW